MPKAKATKQNKAAFYRRILSSRKPGQSLSDLARKHSIRPGTLYSYRSYQKRSSSEKSSGSPAVQSPSFIPVIITPEHRSMPDQPFELRLSDQLILTIPSHFKTEQLQKILPRDKAIAALCSAGGTC